jgi:hypothetical protein
MDVFTLIVVGGLLSVVGLFLGIGLFHRSRAMDIANKGVQRTWETQATVEEGDIPQMVEGQNAYRRRRGQAAISPADVRRQAAARQRRSLDRAEKRRRELAPP